MVVLATLDWVMWAVADPDTRVSHFFSFCSGAPVRLGLINIQKAFAAYGAQERQTEQAFRKAVFR